MQFQLLVVLFALCGLTNAASLLPVLRAEQNFNQMLLKTMADFGSDATNTRACFQAYVKELNNRGDLFENEMLGCETDAANGRAIVDAQLDDDRTQISTSSGDICTQFQACDASENSLDFFNCYVGSSTEAEKTSGTIDFDATRAVQTLNLGYASIQGVLEECTSTATNNYETDVVTLQEKLEDCNAGKVTPGGK